MAIAAGRSTDSSSTRFHYWKDPAPSEVGANVFEFLKLLPGPTHIHLSGKDESRCRFATTLLHGNEPSGLHAVFNVLQNQVTPVVDIHILIPSVDAAKQAPGFIYRMLPHHKDLNRCFQSPFGNTEQDALAQEILAKLHDFNPECVIDIHNTSGSSPSFGVTTFLDPQHDALVSLFTHRMILTDIKLGALMEISESMMPTVTIECGGSQDKESHLLATEGLTRYITQEDVLTQHPTDMSLELFHNPMRLELQESSAIAFGDHCLLHDGVTLLPDIENYNFGYVDSHRRLGFVSGGLDKNLIVKNPLGETPASNYFKLVDGALHPARRLKLFMVTTNPEIARTDCLFYLVEASEE
jgi:hypothetical protein